MENTSFKAASSSGILSDDVNSTDQNRNSDVHAAPVQVQTKPVQEVAKFSKTKIFLLAMLAIVLLAVFTFCILLLTSIAKKTDLGLGAFGRCLLSIQNSIEAFCKAHPNWFCLIMVGVSAVLLFALIVAVCCSKSSESSESTKEVKEVKENRKTVVV